MTEKKILFAIGGDFLGKWLPVCIAKALPHAECRFIGMLWSDGYFVRREGLSYKCWPWRFPEKLPADFIPNLTDLHIRGINPDAVPMSVQHTFSILQRQIEREMDDFKSDAVVYLTAESAIGYLMDTLARQKGILSIGLQTTFLRNSLLVHPFGRSWWKALRDIPVSPSLNDHAEHDPTPLHVPRPTTAERFVRSGLVSMSRAERALRTLVGAPSFDTRAGLLSLVSVKGVGRPGYFPNLGTQDIGDDVPDDFVLVALHRPVLDEGQPTWLDLLRFAIEATPEDTLLVVRPHPNEPGRPIPVDLLAALRNRGVRVSRPGKGAGLNGLLKKSRAFLTLSSASGVQALRAGVPTVTLAPAFYARPGMALATDFREPQVLQAQLARGNLPKPDVESVLNFTRWIEESRSASLPPISDDAAVASALAKRICLLIEGHVQ